MSIIHRSLTKVSLYLALACLLLETNLLYGVSIDLTLSNATGSTSQFGTAAGNLLNDPFGYDPNLPYFSVASVPAAAIPDTGFSGPSAFVTGSDATDRFWQADVALGGSTLDWVDLWGRTNAALGEDIRHQNLTFTFFSGSGGTGSLLGTSNAFDPSDQTQFVAGSAYGRFDVSTVLNATQRGQVGSFRIDQPAMPAPGQFMLLQEIRAAAGEPVSPVPLAFIDRDTGEVSIVNGDTSRNLAAYSITSAAGALNQAVWDSISSGTSNGSLDPDAWTNLSASISDGTNISEAELPGGSGGYNLAAAETLSLGPIWSKLATEDVQILLLNSDGSTATPAVVYSGNGGSSFLEGDLDFNNTVNLADWALFRSGFGGVFSSLTGGQTYTQGDLDGDLDVDVDDFRAFEAAYDAANPGASLASALAGVPEPATAGLLLVGLLCSGFMSLRSKSAGLLPSWSLGRVVAAFLGVALVGGPACAQTFTIIPAPANPAADVTESLAFNASFVAANMFDTAVVEADINVRNLGGVDTEFATRGQGPVSVFVDNNASITTNWIAYAQRSASLDAVGTIEVWFSDTDFGDVLPATAPDAVADIADRSNLDRFNSFPLSSTVSGRYAAMRFTRAPEGTINIGGREFRFLEGPDQFTLEVNTATGGISIKNAGAFAQNLDIDAYEIASPGGSLSATGFSGLAGAAGFPAASGDDLGDGWELGAASNSSLLAEAFLLGESTVSTNAALEIGAGYDASVDARDLTFSYSLENGLKLVGAVEYVTPPGVAGDYNDDGVVNAADYTVWRDNLGGDSAILANNLIPGTITNDHYVQWRDQYGATVATSSANSVPEPTAFGLSLLGVALVSFKTRRRRHPQISSSLNREATQVVNKALPTLCLGIASSVVFFTLASLAPASTPDRIYLLGDDSDEAPAGTVNELGASNLGAVIGSQTGTSFDGFTLDHAGDATNLNTYADLTPVGDPLYIDVGDAGLERPGTNGVSVGADFDGNDYLTTINGFGNPSNGDDSYESTISYTGLINHYAQGWARPTSAGSPGQRQTVIRDTDQFRIHIDTDQSGVARWGHFYANSSQLTGTPVNLNEWAHVAQFSNGNRGILWVDGVVAGVIGGFYQPNGGGPEGGNQGALSLSLGADVTGSASTPSNFFTGQLDDFDIRVAGDNSAETAGSNYGVFDLEFDNAFIANLVATGQLVAGDVNGDLLVNGDGTGDPSTDDVSFFVDHYLDQQVVDFEIVGDLNSRTQMADLNYSGTTNLFDWFELIQNHEDAGLAQSLDLGSIIASRGVPEPTTAALSSLLLALLGVNRGRSRAQSS